MRRIKAKGRTADKKKVISDWLPDQQRQAVDRGGVFEELLSAKLLVVTVRWYQSNRPVQYQPYPKSLDANPSPSICAYFDRVG